MESGAFTATGGPVERREHAECVLEFPGRRREDLVAGLDLARVDDPLAREAEQARAPRRVAQAVGIPDLPVWAVDRLEAEGMRRGGDARSCVVPLVPRILGHELADRALWDAQGGGVVPRAEHERLQAPGGPRDPFHLDQTVRRLDLHLEADLPVEPVCRLEAGQGLVYELDVRSALDLRHDDAVEAHRGALHDELQVGRPPLGCEPVYAYGKRARPPPLIDESPGRALSGLVVLGGWGDRVLEVDDDHVRGKLWRLREGALADGGDREAGAPKAVGRSHGCEYCPARMDFAAPAELTEIRSAVRELCSRFPGEYWRELEPDRYPEEFVAALTEHGWLAALIPEAYGGAGLDLTAASVILEEINASGGNAAACHAQMYVMGTLLRHGSDEQKQRFLPAIASGEVRLQAFGITEPTVGSDTTQIQTSAERVAAGYLIRGQKIWTSRALHSDLMLLLARTTPLDEVEKRTGGLSVFVVDMKAAGEKLEIRPIRTMMNHATTEVFFDGVEIPEDALVGEEGRGFHYILDAMNAERILIAAECIGDGRWFVDQAARYASARVVFGRPIGANQGVQFPIARAHAAIEAADLVRYKAAWLFEHGELCGPEANMAKLLASEASWQAANACLDAHGGYGFAAEYDVERKFRETRLYSIAPISNNLVLAYLGQHVLGMPRSY